MMVQSHEGVGRRQYRQQQRKREVDLPEHGKPGGVSPANVRHGDDARPRQRCQKFIRFLLTSSS